MASGSKQHTAGSSIMVGMEQTLSFRWEQPMEDKLLNVEWITIRKDDGTEEHWPVEVEQVVSHGNCVAIKTKAFGS